MSKEKQIEEMAKVIASARGFNCTEKDRCDSSCPVFKCEGCICYEHSAILYDAGYRKQRGGEWAINGVDGNIIGNWRCSACNGVSLKDSNFCPNCGAKMKGGE